MLITTSEKYLKQCLKPLLLICFNLLSLSFLYAAESGVLQINVYEKELSRPIANATISVAAQNRADESESSRTDSQGVATVSELFPGLYQISVMKDNYTTVVVASVRVNARKTRSIDIEMSVADSVNTVKNEDAIEEVLVVGKTADQYAAASSSILTQDQLQGAGSGSDVLLSLDGLPGLAAAGEFASFNVRGRGPRDNLIFIDEFPYDRAVHFDATLGEAEDIGGGGRFSIFAPQTVTSAEFSPGGWSAAYGGRGAASLLKLDLAEGNPSPSASLRWDLAGYEIGYDGPTGLIDDSTLFFSARSLDFGSVFETIDELDIGQPTLRDVILKSVTDLDENNTLEVLLIDTHEDYTRDINNVINSPNFEDASLQSAEQDSDLYGLTWKRFIGDNTTLTNRFYYRNTDKLSSEGEAYPGLVPEDTPASDIPVREDILSVGEKEKEFGWRADLKTRNRYGLLNAGLRLSKVDANYFTELSDDWIRYAYDQDDQRAPGQNYIVLTPVQTNANFSQSATNYSAFLEQIFEMGDWDIRPGIRYDRDGLSDENLFSPRLSVNWNPTDRMRYFGTAGLFYQSPRYLDVAANSDNQLKNEKVTHTSLGFEKRFGNKWKWLNEVYYQILDDIIVDKDSVSGTFANNGTGKSYGFDSVLTRSFDNGWSVTSSYSYNDATIDKQDGNGSLPTEFSREHVASISAQWEINDHWKLSSRYKYLSGRPFDTYTIHADVLGAGEPLRYSRETIAQNVGRYDGYGLLNFRVDYQRRVGPFDMTTFVDLLNVTAAGASDVVEFDPRRGINVVDTGELQPLIGLRFDYSW